MKTAYTRHLIGAVLVAALVWALACAPEVRAQSIESEPAPAAGEYKAAPLPPREQPFLILELPQSFVEKTQVQSRLFSAQLGKVLLVDYSAFQQDTSSLAQVGRQSDQWDARSIRPSMSGTIGDDYEVSYLVAAEYQGFATEPGDA